MSVHGSETGSVAMAGAPGGNGKSIEEEIEEELRRRAQLGELTSHPLPIAPSSQFGDVGTQQSGIHPIVPSAPEYPMQSPQVPGYAPRQTHLLPTTRTSEVQSPLHEDLRKRTEQAFGVVETQHKVLQDRLDVTKSTVDFVAAQQQELKAQSARAEQLAKDLRNLLAAESQSIRTAGNEALDEFVHVMEIEKSARHKTEKQIFVLQQELEHGNESVAQMQAELQKEQMIRQKLEADLNVYANKEEQRRKTLHDSVNELLAKDNERAETTRAHMKLLQETKSRIDSQDQEIKNLRDELFVEKAKVLSLQSVNTSDFEFQKQGNPKTRISPKEKGKGVFGSEILSPESSSHGNSQKDGSFGSVQWKPKEPPTFAGKLSEDVIQWFRIVKDYLRFMGGTEEMQISYIITLLSGAARDHWDVQVDAMAGTRPATVQDLENMMVDRFGHSSRHKENLHKILTMRQGKQSIREFSHAFQNACGKLSTYDDNWAMQIFTWALNHDIALQVSMANPSCLAEAIQKAEDVDMARRYASMTSDRFTGSGNPQGQMQGGNQRNWRGGQRGFFRGGRQQFRGRFSGGRQGGRQPWQKNNSNVEDAQMRTIEGNKSQNVQCFNCGGNHYAAGCPNRRGQRGGRFGRTGPNRGASRNRGGNSGRVSSVAVPESTRGFWTWTPGQGGTVHQQAPNDGVLHHPGTQSQGN